MEGGRRGGRCGNARGGGGLRGRDRERRGVGSIERRKKQEGKKRKGRKKGRGGVGGALAETGVIVEGSKGGNEEEREEVGGTEGVE